jgi:hydrogenase/urease accessory protein HupE
MSAPTTNLEKQKRRHRPALKGMAITVAFVAALFLGYLTVLAERSTPADETSSAVAVEPSR